MYNAFIGYDLEGKELWTDYSWLKNGCINDQYFNWMYSMWTGNDSITKEMIKEGTPHRKFINSGISAPVANNDLTTHCPRFILVLI